MKKQHKSQQAENLRESCIEFLKRPLVLIGVDRSFQGDAHKLDLCHGGIAALGWGSLDFLIVNPSGDIGLAVLHDTVQDFRPDGVIGDDIDFCEVQLGPNGSIFLQCSLPLYHP